MVAVWRAQVELVRRRDYAALRALFAEGYRGVDHRTVGWEELEGPDALVELMRTTTGRGDGEMSGEVLAVADGLSLRAQRFAGHDAHGGAFEAVFHAITVVRDGLIVREEFFAPEAPRGGAGAVRRAGSRRSASRTGSTPLTRWWSSRAVWAATAHRGDWERLGALFAEDYESVDHRRLAWEPIHGRDGAVRLLRSSYGGVEAARLTVDVFAADEHGFVRAINFTGRSPEGAAFEHAHGAVALVGDGVIYREERFEADDRAWLLARFEELRAERENTVVRARARLDDGVRVEGWGCGAVPLGRRRAVVDHRPLGFGDARGIDGMTALVKGLADVGIDRWRSEVVAVHGDRLALFADRLSGTEPAAACRGAAPRAMRRRRPGLAGGHLRRRGRARRARTVQRARGGAQGRGRAPRRAPPRRLGGVGRRLRTGRRDRVPPDT